ncbi:hypothetical protein BG006_002801 [Podila minutissima]|uniref:G-protein coupled receptors family 2 profile 2 domain-containing protein n=1 Tax=Podila minutissima TaxID=64525 RepID=A0A9P5SXJ9_9FUNG|nr:hypothetical protein BG006_002801 [Podila minutissima]
MGCPPPLLPNFNSLVSDTCLGPCCLPCPASSTFYEPGQLENIYTITSIIRVISASACGFLSIAYLLLPSRRQHPHLIVLVFAMLMVPWEALGTAWLAKKEDLLCKSPYEAANMTNSWLCGVQGITLYYIVLVMCCLSVLLIANLHLLIVHRSSVIQNSMSRLMVISFLLPLAMVVPVAVRKDIENPGFGSICFLSAKAASPFFFYPLAGVVSLASLMHLGTIVYMIKTKLRANASETVRHSASFSQTDSQGNPISRKQSRLQTARNISLMLKQQWRPGLFALFLLIIDMSYWLFYFTEAKKLLSVGPNTDWLVQWLTCLSHQAMVSMQSGVLSATSGPAEFKAAGDNAQRACVYVAKPHIPAFAWVAASELLPAMFGIAVLMIFGCRMELWQDLRTRLFHSSKGQDGTIMMGQITKDAKDRHLPQQKQNHLPKQQADKIQEIKGANDGFYDEDLGGPDNPTDPYGSRMNLSLNTTPAVLGGPTLKCSVQHIANTAMGQRSPPYSPAQQQYNLKSTRGGVPPDPSNWPSWPSTYTTTPTSPARGYFASSPTSPGSGKSLLSADDIDLLASPSRGSTYRQHKDDVVREASRSRLGYRQSTMGRPQHIQATPRSTGDNQG